MTRDEAKAAIRSLEGRVVGSVSTKTDYVVVGDNPGSKLQKARRLEIEVLEEADFKRLLDGGVAGGSPLAAGNGREAPAVPLREPVTSGEEQSAGDAQGLAAPAPFAGRTFVPGRQTADEAGRCQGAHRGPGGAGHRLRQPQYRLCRGRREPGLEAAQGRATGRGRHRRGGLPGAPGGRACRGGSSGAGG